MGEERRKSIRVKKVISVRYSYDDDTGEKKWDMTVLKDISETGMCISTHKLFSPNDIMTFLIKIPTRPLDWIEFTGRVVGAETSKSASGETIGGSHATRVEFINLRDEQKELIREYVAWFLTKPR